MEPKPDFDTLVERHSAELFRYLWRMLSDEADAQDCLQDTYLRAFRAYGRIEDTRHLRAWLYKIATNVARSHLVRAGKRRQREGQLLEPMAAGGKGLGALVAERSELAEVQQAVLALPDNQRAALMMRKYQQLEYEEIAAALGCSQDAARANLYQAVKKLRAQFREVQDE